MLKLSKSLKLLALILALACALPVALAEAGVEAVVSADGMNVYAQAAPHALLGTLPKGTRVTVTARSGDAALIQYNGKTGVARVSDMARADSAEAQPAQSADSGKAMVANRDTRIYSKASTSSAYASVKSGTGLTLLAVNGSCARVLLDGKTGYMVYGHLSEPGEAAQPEAASVVQPAVTTVNAPAVTTQSARVYAKADTSGDSVAVGKGVKLTVLAIRGEVAMVEKGGAIGYMSTAYLQKDDGSAASATPAKSGSNPFSSGSNEHAIYGYLTGEMGYNRAAAMGVMANIKYESSYNPDCNGDGGTSYGICQWHAGRKTNLISYCADNGLDYTTLDGQLRFLKYELTTRYPSVHSYMKQVDDTADGAYDAGYYFCFNFEAPAARTSQSTKRGNYAKDTLWEK